MRWIKIGFIINVAIVTLSSVACNEQNPQKSHNQKLKLPTKIKKYVSENNIKSIKKFLTEHPEYANGFYGAEETPFIHLAIQADNWEILRLLINAKADLTTLDSSEKNILMCAIVHEAPPSVIDYLIKQFDLAAKNENGNTALHFAAIQGNTQATQKLLNNKANINAQNNRGNTPLHEAYNSNHPDIIALLVKYQADQTIKNKAGLTVLEIAQKDLAARSGKNDGIENIISILKGITHSSSQTSQETKRQEEWEPTTLAEFLARCRKQDAFTILSIPLTAQEDEVRKAYKELAKKWHPDKWKAVGDKEFEDANEAFKIITKAHDDALEITKK